MFDNGSLGIILCGSFKLCKNSAGNCKSFFLSRVLLSSRHHAQHTTQTDQRREASCETRTDDLQSINGVTVVKQWTTRAMMSVRLCGKNRTGCKTSPKKYLELGIWKTRDFQSPHGTRSLFHSSRVSWVGDSTQFLHLVSLRNSWDFFSFFSTWNCNFFYCFCMFSTFHGLRRLFGRNFWSTMNLSTWRTHTAHDGYRECFN